MPIEKILLGTDFSEQAGLALHDAMSIARHAGGEVVLVHAARVPSPAASEPLEREIEAALAADRSELEALRLRYQGQGVSISHLVVDGFAESAIAQAADELDADLVVVGTHGRRGVQRFFLGSIAERVVRMSERSVLVVRKGGGEAQGYRRILVPTDFSETSERALPMAMDLVAPDGVIELLHCYQLPGPVVGVWGPAPDPGPTLSPLRAELREWAEEQSRSLVARHRKRHERIDYTIVEDIPTRGIQQRLAEGDYDLVAIGSHGRRGFRRWLVGSVAEATVRYSECSVLVVKPPPHARESADASPPASGARTTRTEERA